MVTGALAPYHDGPALHFVSNVDPSHLYDVLQNCTPERTQFIVTSRHLQHKKPWQMQI